MIKERQILMKKLKTALAIALAIILIVTASYFVGMYKGKLSGQPQITSSILEEQIQSVRELTTIKYHYTSVGSFENQSEFYGIKIPLTLKKFIVSYDGEINAGVVLSDIKVSLDEDTIRVKLPPAQILYHEIDEDSLKIFDEKASIFNPLQLGDYSSFRIDQMAEMENKAKEKGLLVEAEEDAKKAVEDILKIYPEVEEKYKIIFE
jgi:hypothetical protein